MEDSSKLVKALQQQQMNIVAQLAQSNPKWCELQGAINALEGKYKLEEDSDAEESAEEV